MIANSIPSNLTAGEVRPGYDPGWFDVLAEVEERHFWFQARNRVIAAGVRPLVAEFGPRTRLLEVGCGNGNVLRVLRQLCPDGTVVGLDLFQEGLDHARRRCQCELVSGDILRAPFPDGSFDLVGMFDVLEHLPEDLQALRALHSLLVPGGAAVLTVPACPALWSYFDEIGGHCRRYEAADLKNRLSEAGFEVSYLSYFMTTIFPLVWVARRLGNRGRSSAEKDSSEPVARALNELKVRPVVNGLLLRLLTWESRWIARGGRLPKGASLLAVARKRS